MRRWLRNQKDFRTNWAAWNQGQGHRLASKEESKGKRGHQPMMMMRLPSGYGSFSGGGAQRSKGCTEEQMGERLRQGFRRAKVALRLLKCGIGGPKMKAFNHSGVPAACRPSTPVAQPSPDYCRALGDGSGFGELAFRRGKLLNQSLHFAGGARVCLVLPRGEMCGID